MHSLDVWDGLLLAAAAFIAVTSLARLMARRREQLTDQFRTEMEQHRQQSARKKPEEDADQEEAA